MHAVTVYDLTLAAPAGEPALPAVGKLAVARCLAALQVDVIEIGAPAASVAEQASARLICREVQGPAVAARCDLEHDHISRTCEAIGEAHHPILQLMLRCDPMFYQYQPTLVQQEVLERVATSVTFARSHGVTVQLTLENAPRLEGRFLSRLLATAVGAGAGGLVLADSVGAALAAEMTHLVNAARASVTSAGASIGVFCSNEHGMAVANTLAAVQAGATQVAATLSGRGPSAEGPYLDKLLPGLRRWCKGCHAAMTPQAVTAASRQVAALMRQVAAGQQD